MKLITALMLVGLLNSFAGGLSQDALISINIQNGSLNDLFDAIEKKTDYRVFYKSNIIDNSYKINLSAEQKPVNELLTLALEKKNLTFDLVDKVIVITTAELNKQQILVSGKITDASTGEPVIGVNIIIKGTTIGVITDVNGNYSIEVPDKDAVLVLSCIGYTSEEIGVAGQSTINITLIPDIQALDEIVVVGYGVQTKASVTGSVATVKGEDIAKSQSADVMSSLAGHLPGLVITTRTGEPGNENLDIFIRGKSTTGSTDPLIIIDGVQRDNLSTINPSDIDNISVLKDASAAIYGARAANGVILITTKRGEAGPPVFNFTYNQGFAQSTRLPKVADSYTFAKVYNEININEGQPAPYTDAQLELFRNGTDPNYPNTDWFDEMVEKYTPQSRLNLSVSGGNDYLNYYLSLGKMGQDGHFKYGSTRIDRYNFRSNVTVNATKHVKIGLDLAGTLNDRHYPGNADAYGIYSHLYLYQPNWTLFWPGTDKPKPLRDSQSLINWVSDKGGYQDLTGKLLQSRLNLDIAIPWVDGLAVTGSANYDVQYDQTKYFKKPTYVYYTPDSIGLAGGDAVKKAQLTERFDHATTLTVNAMIKYNKLINKHRIGLMVGYEQMEYNYNYIQAQRTDFESTALPELFAGSSDKTKQSNNGTSDKTSRSNYFGRATYDYAGKYLAEFIFRADASPNFPEGKRWGYFPGIMVGWRVSEESFMDNLTFLDNLKIRASYGEMGNDSIPPYQYIARYVVSDNLNSSGGFLDEGYVIGGTDVLGLIPTGTHNPDITWEVAKTTNIGLDASLWNGLLGFEFDWFKTTRSNILMKREVVVPDFAGLDLPLQNAGKMENKGFELLLTHRNKLANDFQYSLTGSISFARNKVIIGTEPPAAEEYQKVKGKPIGAQTFYEAIGIYRDQTQIDQTPHMAGARPGDIIYKDLNNDSIIDSKDMKRIDQTYDPEIVYTFGGSFSYKNFDLSFMFLGQENAKTYLYNYEPEAWQTPQPYFAVMSNSLGNFMQWRADGRWAPDQTENATMPRGSTNNFNNNTLASTQWLFDGGFLRLKSVELGYTLPSRITEKVKIKNLRVYVSGYNLFIVYDDMKDLGIDPESNNFWEYPQQRLYNFGFNLTF